MKILIVNCGLLRTFQDVFENQYKNLYIPNSHHTIKTVLVTEPLPLKRRELTAKLIQEVYCDKLDDFKTVLIRPNPNIRQGYMSFKEQFRKLEAGLDSIDDLEEYDQVIRIRPDLLLEKPVIIEDFNGLQGIVGWTLTGSHQLMHDVFFLGKPEYLRTITEFKKGYLYVVNKKEHFYFSKANGKEAEVQILLHAGFNNIDVKGLDTGVFVLKNEQQKEELETNRRRYYKLRTDLPIVHNKEAIRRIQ